jgi:ParB-like chromosome segregation protein Spo0J
MECHELVNLFPRMSEQQLEELAADIREHGLRQPIVLFEGKILDGRHRYQACLKADVEPQIENYSGNDPVAYVVSLNLRRRHLDESQRAMIAAGLAKMRQGARTDLAPNGAMSDADAAKLLNVSERSVERAKAVLRDAVPEAIEAVDRGEVTVSAAHQFSKQSKEEQRKKIKSAGSAGAAAKGQRRPVAARSETGKKPVGVVANPMPKKKPPRSRVRDPESADACRTYRLIQQLAANLPVPEVFWRCVLFYDGGEISRNLAKLMESLNAIQEKAPLSTRH